MHPKLRSQCSSFLKGSWTEAAAWIFTSIRKEPKHVVEVKRILRMILLWTLSSCCSQIWTWCILVTKYQATMYMLKTTLTYSAFWCTPLAFQYCIHSQACSTSCCTGCIRHSCWGITRRLQSLMSNCHCIPHTGLRWECFSMGWPACLWSQIVSCCLIQITLTKRRHKKSTITEPWVNS